MVSVTLRPALVSDIDALLALWRVAAENDTRPVDTADAVHRLLERDPDACTVAEAGGRIVGSVISGWDGWRAHLYRLAVHPDVRRQGIGRALLDHAGARLAALGANRLDAMVLDGNELGQTIWRSSGFSPQSQWRRWVRPV